MNNSINNVNYSNNAIGDSKKTSQTTSKNNDTDVSMSQQKKLVDTVSITQAAKKLTRLSSVTNTTMPITDSTQLDAIKQSIANGTYTIDSKTIADKLIEFE